MPDRPDHLADVDIIDVLCDECEAALRRGEEVDLTRFVQRCEPRLHDRLIADLLDLQLHHSRRLGKPASREDYLRRYPALRAHIEAFEFRRGVELNGPASPADHTAGLRPDAYIGRYQLVTEAGHGATGVVWKAIDHRMRRVVAIKTPNRPGLSDEELRRFLREGWCASRLVHSNIVRLFDAGRDGPYAYLVFEFIEGRSLSDEIKQGAVPSDDAARLCKKIAGALHYAHGLGVIHRDVKPGNILLDADGEPRLTDFGLARLEQDTGLQTLDQCVLGTPAYMAPEQARGEQARVDHRADVYGLGAVLVALLNGRSPSEGTSHEILARLKDASEGLSPRRIDKRVPRDLDAICRKATEPALDKRYPDAGSLADDLSRYLRGEPPVARIPSLISLAWCRMRRRPKNAVIGALVIAVMGLAGLMVIYAPQSDQRPVVIETEPTGARVAFVPLDKQAGKPLVAQAVIGRQAKGGKVNASLSPGMYFVVAATRDGRFHEVYRWVPRDSQGPPPNNRLNSRLDKHGQITLAKITIPVRGAPGNAHLFASADRFYPGFPGSTEVDDVRRGIVLQPYYMDRAELTVAEARRLPSPLSDRLPTDQDDFAYTASFYAALSAAEQLGKRLPTEAEYEYAATAGGTQRYPWGDSSPEDRRLSGFGQVGDIDFDRTTQSSEIRGLCSNVAEWTVSVGPLADGTLNDYRVVRGGDQSVIAGDARVTAASRDPLNRRLLSPYTSSPSVGFRCVRSFEPLIRFEEMR